MSVAAYGMLLHSYRWKLHYRVATVMTEEGNNSNMVLARHWLQVPCAIAIDWVALSRHRLQKYAWHYCDVDVDYTGTSVLIRFRQIGHKAEHDSDKAY